MIFWYWFDWCFSFLIRKNKYDIPQFQENLKISNQNYVCMCVKQFTCFIDEFNKLAWWCVYRGAPYEYVHPYKLKLLWLNIIPDDELMDSDDIAYDLYQHACDWMQQSCMKMLPDHISENQILTSCTEGKVMTKSRPASKGVTSFKCPMCFVYKCLAGLRIMEGPGFGQLESCCIHRIYSHVFRVMSACKSFISCLNHAQCLEQRPDESISDHHAGDCQLSWFLKLFSHMQSYRI